MPGIAEQLTTNKFVHSPLNLHGFYKWVSTASEEEIDEVMQVIYTVEHRMGDLEELFPTQPLGFIRYDFGRRWVMRWRYCEEAYCVRCNMGCGGWQFRWIGPWTCPNIVGDESTSAAEVLRRAMLCTCGRH